MVIRYAKKYEFIQKPDPSKIKMEIVEVLNIVGLNHVRALNHPFSEIALIHNNYHQGVLIYKRNEEAETTTNVRYNDYRLLSRFSVKVTHEPLVKMIKGDHQFAAETSEEQSHLLVFEHVFRDVDEELIITIKKPEELFEFAVYNQWKLVDIDGFFGGNSFKREAGKIIVEDFRE